MTFDPIVSVAGVSHAYEHVPVLHDVSVSVNEGERVLILGANGAGKSTLAMVMAGLAHPQSGSVRLFGEPIDGLPAYRIARLGLSYTPAYRSVFPYMTVEENLHLGSEVLARFREGEAGEVSERQLDLVYRLFPQLADLRKTRAGTLSGGVQRMVEIGRSLMGAPQVLILDEPSLGLAQGVINELVSALRVLADHGITLIMIEQNVPVAAAVCDRGYLMDGGRIALAATAAELLDSDQVKRTYLGVI